jgi:hypothetical protein
MSEYVGAAGTSSPFIVPANGTVRNDDLCLPPGLSHVMLPMSRTLPLGVYDLEVRYRSAGQSAFTPYAVPIGGSRSRPLSTGVQLPADNDAVVTTLAPSSMREVSLLVSSNAGICFQSITVGIPGPG